MRSARIPEGDGTGLAIARMAQGLDFVISVGKSRCVTRSHESEPRREDSPLVAAARDGDRGAFGELYSRYARVVHGILLSRIPPADVEDLVQDVFLRAMRRLHTLRDAAAFAGWLAALARNCAADYHRGSRELVELQEDCAEAPPPQAEALAILAVIQSLPEAYREPLVLRLVEGLTGPEIASRTGLTPGSVRVNLHRGMQQLREKLGAKRSE